MNRTQLADAMLKGSQAQGVTEDRKHYITVDDDLFMSGKHICLVCALGAGLVGKHDGDFHKAAQEFEQWEGFDEESDEAAIFADLLEIPRELAVPVEIKHLNGRSIEDIAAWLKSSE